MRKPLSLPVLAGMLLLCSAVGAADSTPTVVQANLTDAGTPPFHLVASISESADLTEHGEIEIYWASHDKWRRTIQSKDFSQTLIVNGDRIYEEDSEDYFPLALQTLATALINPNPVLASWRQGDELITKSNGNADESGNVCVTADICAKSNFGLTETVGSKGHSVTFMDYQNFEGVRVARSLECKIDRGDSLQAHVIELSKMAQVDESLFRIPRGKPKSTPIQSVMVNESDLRQQALQPLQIIWPQVLDGKIDGDTSYYVSLDRSGQVQEVLPLSINIERADDSARRQIMRWKFKPVMKDGVAVQAECILNFSFNTRAYGPSRMLSDEQARKLASDIVDPVFPPGTPTGSTCAVRIAVDSDGNIIEQIPGECGSGLYQLCSAAIGKWHFKPIVQSGMHLPYRAEIVFRTP